MDRDRVQVLLASNSNVDKKRSLLSLTSASPYDFLKLKLGQKCGAHSAPLVNLSSFLLSQNPKDTYTMEFKKIIQQPEKNISLVP